MLRTLYVIEEQNFKKYLVRQHYYKFTTMFTKQKFRVNI